MVTSNKIWWTRKARIHTEKRLLANDFQSQVILLWYSFFGVSVSIYYLGFESGASEQLKSVSWVVYSVLVLVMSGFVNGLSLRSRAALIKDCYESLDQLYYKSLSDGDQDHVFEEYQKILSLCENHTDDDFNRAVCESFLLHKTPYCKENGLSILPTRYHWFTLGWSIFKRFSFLSIIYLLPVFLFIALESYYECH